MAEAGVITGASDRNWASYGDHVRLAPNLPARDDDRLLSDPQTSGGLLVSCAPDSVPAVLDIFNRHGATRAAKVGDMVAGRTTVEVNA